MEQQTAVDELIDWMNKQYKMCSPMAPAIPFIRIAIDKVILLKEKEKRNIINAYEKGTLDGYEPNYGNGEQYYNETYNK